MRSLGDTLSIDEWALISLGAWVERQDDFLQALTELPQYPGALKTIISGGLQEDSGIDESSALVAAFIVCNNLARAVDTRLGGGSNEYSQELINGMAMSDFRLALWIASGRDIRKLGEIVTLKGKVSSQFSEEIRGVLASVDNQHAYSRIGAEGRAAARGLLQVVGSDHLLACLPREPARVPSG